MSSGGDFARDYADAGRDEHFAGYARRRVLRQNGVENGVGNVVGNFVGVTFGNGFGREQMPMFMNFCHGFSGIDFTMSTVD